MGARLTEPVQQWLMAEEALDDGITNAGAVVRDGDHLLRPSTPHTESVHALLRSVRAYGFRGAPLPIGVDPDGRERLEFVPGEVPAVPYEPWVQSEDALASVARLLRQFHDAARSFDATNFAWSSELADPLGGAMVCHNDLEPTNVVFQGGEAVAFIDFEFAAPGRPEYDLAQLARLWVPFEHEFDQERMGWQTTEPAARLRVIADAYGLDRRGRASLREAIIDALAVAESIGRRMPIEVLNRQGGPAKYERRAEWLDCHRASFDAVLA